MGNKNYLEEDLIIGLFSSIILFFIFFSLHELKKESLRELRLKIKKVYRIQNELLEVYYFFVSTVSKFFFKYLKKKTFLTKLIYLKSLNLKILNKLVLKLSLKLIN